MSFENPDVWRDEDADEDFWIRAGVEETITPELRVKIDAVKDAREPLNAAGVPRTGIAGRIRFGINGLSNNPFVNKEFRLTQRKIEVLELMAEGYSNDEIGEKLLLEKETVKHHIGQLLGLLSARNRTHAVTIGFRNGILDPDGEAK